MIHPATELRPVNKDKGLGIFAKSLIPKGTLTYVKDDLEIEIGPDDPRLNDPLLKGIIETYSYIDERGMRIVSWDHAKYVNHCCHCNTMSTGYGFEIAIRDISAGEEITDEYGMFNFDYRLDLKCSKSGCRGTVSGTDLEDYYIEWDQKVKSALQYFDDVAQPLLPFLNDSVLQNVKTYLITNQGYKSVLSLAPEDKAHPSSV
ncbi:MAG TPA: SET domain-containing protein [Balneolaceae bacterium]|nr:SET domain-containing protein [Balneolaceae bacterium]